MPARAGKGIPALSLKDVVQLLIQSYKVLGNINVRSIAMVRDRSTGETLMVMAEQKIPGPFHIVDPLDKTMTTSYDDGKPSLQLDTDALN